MLRKAAVLLTIALLVLMMVPAYASADGPPPDMTITVDIQNASADVSYIDILVDKTLPEIMTYLPNQNVLSKYPDLSKSELIGLDSNGFVSYSLYYKNSLIQDNDLLMKVSFPSSQNLFPGLDAYDIDKIKLVALDREGRILKVTDPISLWLDNDFFTISRPTVVYDFKNNTATAKLTKNLDTFYLIIYVLMSIVRIFFSTMIELIIALPFKIKPLKVVVLANVLTQVLITIGIPILQNFMPYAIAVAIFEVMVVIIEYLIYMKYTNQPKWSKVLLYTLVANSVSLITILLLNK